MCAHPASVNATSRPSRSRTRQIVATDGRSHPAPGNGREASIPDERKRYPVAAPSGTSTAFITDPAAISASARFASAKG